MLLLDLPQELLLTIIKATLPEGFEDLVLSCKTVYGLAATEIRRYNSLKLKYGHVSIDRSNLHAPGQIRHPIELLYEIQKDPLVARYIRSADLDGARAPNASEQYKRHEIEKMRLCNGAYPLLRDSPYLRAAGQDPLMWHEAILRGELPQAFMLLLSLLSNLTKLRLSKEWTQEGFRCRNDKDKGTGDVLDIIVAGSTAHQLPSALPKLALLLPFLHPSYDLAANLRLAIPFLAPPSMYKFIGSGYSADRFWTGPYDWLYPDRMSSIQEIEMVAGAVSANHMIKFLVPFEYLRSFRWNHAAHYNGTGWSWDCGAFLAALKNRTANRLHTLSITEERSADEGRTAITSFLEFEQLTHLEFGVGVLLGTPYSGLSDRAEFSGIGHNSSKSEGLKVSVRLIDIVPKNVKTIRIVAPNPTARNQMRDGIDAIGNLFDDFATQRAYKLPKLVQVTIARGVRYEEGRRVAFQSPLPDDLVRQVREAGVELIDDVCHGCPEHMIDFAQRLLT